MSDKAERLLAAAIGAFNNDIVITYDDYVANTLGNSFFYLPLEQDRIHNTNLAHGKVANNRTLQEVFYVMTTTKKLKFEYNPDETVGSLKEKILCEEGIPKDDQRLIFNGHHLRDEHLLSHYSVKANVIIFLVLKHRGGAIIAPTAFYLEPNLRAPKYDYDFQNVRDNEEAYMRGGYWYKRPYGWHRFALKVIDKYENNIWLGSAGCRQFSDDNEWPVSYHGTDRCNLKSIAEDGYRFSRSQRFLFGHGIYSTPDINVAALYATQFQHDGDLYQVVLQNRVNPNTLVRIPKTQTGLGEYWISPKEADVRPYGICIKKVTAPKIIKPVGVISTSLDMFKN